MAVEQNHVQANPQVPLRAKKHTRTVTGSLVASSGVISGLPSKHKITAGDRIDISVTGTAPVALENGVIAASDMSGYLYGALGNVAYLRIDQAQSLFDFPGTYPDQATARAAMEAVFTLGTTVYFDSGIFAGASINVGEFAVAPGQTVHDDTTPGLLSGYWYLILDLSTGVGFPTLAAFAAGETAVSPAVSVNDSAGGNINASGLIVTAAGANSVTIPTGLPDIASFPDLTVHEHSEVADVLLTQELEAASLKVNGESVIAPVSKILYSGNVNNLKVIWSGYDNTSTQISGDTPHKTEITPTDVFNVGVDINLIQILTHPTDNTIGVMLYQDIATSKIYLKSFRYTYEGGFTNSYTPFEIIGADSIDVRAGFVTSVNYLTKVIANVQLVVFGGKDTPGAAVYAGAYVISLSTLAVVETNTWADTGIVIHGTFTSLDRVIDAEYMSDSTTVRMGVTFGSGQFAYFEDLFTFIWDSTSAHIFYHSDIMLGQGSTQILVVNKEEMGSVGSTGDETFRTIASNIHARFRRIYSGSNAGTVMLLKVDKYKGVGSETIGITDFNNDVTIAPRGAVYFDVIPGNIQNGSTRLENLTFDLGNDKILTYKSYGYYVISDRETGQMVYLGKDGIRHLTKADRATAMLINGDTVLYYKSGAWKAQKFMPEGPFLAYTSNAGYAITAPPGVKVEVPYALEPGKTYFWGWDDQLIGMSTIVGTKPALAARRLGIATSSSLFVSEFTHKSNPSYTPYALAYANQAEAEAATSETVVMNPLRTRQLLNAAFDIPRWEKVTVSYAALVSTSPLSANQGVCNLSLPGGTTKLAIHQIVQKHSVAFAGTGITAAVASVGYGLAPLDMQYYSDPLDVYQAVADTAFNNTVSNAITDMVGIANTPRLFVETTGGNISDLTAGTIELWVRYSVLP